MATNNKTNFIQNIRTIAKTPELEARLDQLDKTSILTAKEAIKDVRSSGRATSSGATTAASGGGPGTPSTTGTGSDGNPVVGPLAPPVNNNNDPTKSITQSDSYQNSLSSSNDALQKLQDPDKKPGDLSDKGQDTGASGGGGSPFANQAQRGAKDADVQTAVAALTAAGATQAEIDDYISTATRVETGIHDVSDVYNGLRGPQPGDESILKGVVGVDPDNITKSLLYRFDGWLPYPNDIDARKYGQAGWTDPLSAPVDTATYRTGMYWVGPIDGSHTIYSKTCTDVISAAQAYSTSLDSDSGAFIGFVTSLPVNVNNVIDPITIVDGNPTGIALYALFDSISTPFPDNYFIVSGIGFSQCPGSPGPNTDINIMCFTGAPTQQYTQYPITGLGSLKLGSDGSSQYSPYDTEVPLKYRGGASAIPLKSLIDGVTYLDEVAVNGGHILHRLDNTGYALYYDSSNRLSGIVPASAIPFYLPRAEAKTGLESPGPPEFFFEA